MTPDKVTCTVYLHVKYESKLKTILADALSDDVVDIGSELDALEMILLLSLILIQMSSNHCSLKIQHFLKHCFLT